MFHRFLNTVRSILLGVLAIAAWQPAAAEVYVYEATIIFCATNCDPFAAVSVGSSVIGFLEIDVEPNGTFTETDIVNFGFEIFDSNAGLNPAVFDGATFVNPTESNPLPLDSRVVTFGEPAGYPFDGAIFGGSGTTGPNNELTGGQLVATFAVPPFNTFGAQIFFALGVGNTEGCLFGGMPGSCVALTTLEGGFSQLPGEIVVAENPTVFADTPIDDSSEATITVTNVAPMMGVDPCSMLVHDPATPPPPPFSCPDESGPLTILSVATLDPLADPFSITDNGCDGAVLAPLGS
ncbi:MAG: hypothetical protein OEQ74_06690 [Gammaproteobacteria bacterium]|nr:hypothetical protein [Gammaproteobacteria bacterium]